MVTVHTPVMLEEALEYLITDKNGVYVDCTLGTGGHFSELSRRTGDQSVIVGFDADPQAIAYCKSIHTIPQRHLYVNSNFEHIYKNCFRNGIFEVDGILMDLGMSSFALDDEERGLAFSIDGALDMRFSPEIKITAADFIAKATWEEMAQVFREYGEERQSGLIARKISEVRENTPIQTTKELAEVVGKCVPYKHRIKTLSRIFQAIRIHINRELDVLKSALGQAEDLLKPGGRLVIISYHSLEDKIVKQFYKEKAQGCVCPPEFPVCKCDHKQTFKILTRKVVLSTQEEIEANSRARSAKLRVAEKV